MRRWAWGIGLLLALKLLFFGVSTRLYLLALFSSNVTFYSLEPNRYRPVSGQPRPECLQDFPILGSCPVTPTDRVLLAIGLLLGQMTDPVVIHVRCFNPRHGLRLGDFELLVCFECMRVVEVQGQDRASSGITSLGQPLWEWVRQRHTLPSSKN